MQKKIEYRTGCDPDPYMTVTGENLPFRYDSEENRGAPNGRINVSVKIADRWVETVALTGPMVVETVPPLEGA